MSFLYPAFLIGAASVSIPIVLHLLTREAAPRVPFSAVRFLRRAPVEDSRRRLRELLLLALRVAALLLLAFAFARPFLADASSLEGVGVTIVAVDTSFSMAAPGQFERAKALARDAVKGAGPRSRVGIVRFSDTAEVVARPDGAGEALAAIEPLQPGFGATRYASAIALAAEQIGGGAGRIVLVTDLQKSGWDASPEASLPPRIKVEIADAGSPAGNLAVTDVRVDGGGVVAVIRNTGSVAGRSRARLSVDGKPAHEAAITADPGVFSEVRFAGVPARAGVASVTIDDREGYPADNTRHIVLDPPAPVSLLVVTMLGNAEREAFYLARALMVDEGAFALKTVGVSDLMQTPSDRSHGPAAILLLGTRGLDRRGREWLRRYVQGGGALFAATGPDIDLEASARIFPGIRLRARMRETHSAVSFAPTDARHPIFRPFGEIAGNLGQVRFTRSVLVEEAPGATVLARFSDGAPALLEYRIGDGRVLHFMSDLNREWNDFPLHPTFVPFIQEIARYLTASREAPREYLVGDAPPGVRREPGIVSLPLSAVGGAAAQSAPRTRRAAINVDTRESDPARMGAEQLIRSIGRSDNNDHRVAATAEKAAAQAREDRQRLWQYGLALMLASLVCESALGRKM